MTVVPELFAPSVIVLPSTTITSLAPSTRPLTVKVSPVIVCPDSIVLAAAPPNTFTAAACVPSPAASVKVGLQRRGGQGWRIVDRRDRDQDELTDAVQPAIGRTTRVGDVELKARDAARVGRRPELHAPDVGQGVGTHPTSVVPSARYTLPRLRGWP